VFARASNGELIKMRKKILYVWLAGLTAVAASAIAQEKAPDKAPPETVRAEIATPLQQAQALIVAQQFKEALAKIDEADRVGNKTPHESYLVQRYRGTAALRAGDSAMALKSFEAALATGKVPAAEQRDMVLAIADLAYRNKDYAKAAQFATRYFNEGGTDPKIRALLVQSQYLAGDYAKAAQGIATIIAEEEQAGRRPTEEQLRLLASSYVKTDNAPGYESALEKMVAHYPKPEYWADLVSRVLKRPAVGERLPLDAYRLKHAIGNLKSSEEFEYLAELALRAGWPVEAKKIVDEGYSSGALGKGADAGKHRRLRDRVNIALNEDRQSVAKPDAEIARAQAAPSGDGLVNLGFALVQHGRHDQGLELMERGIQKGALKRPEVSKLHLGLAYLQAGQKEKAVQIFKSVQGEGTADLARLWALKATAVEPTAAAPAR
jgi:Tfp pilus assembly protein PilF